ncbi:hypothetical protein OF83DRAFT_1054814, partial [Amylostereum chailletii]
CDDTDIYTGALKPLDVPRATYAYAQKMRAAISHKFARELGRGAQAWVENPHRKGFYGGNPSLAHSIGQYMISLRRRKTRGGEEAVSAKAITEEVLRRLYEFNINFTGDHDSGSIPREDLKKTMWASRETRLMLNAVYVIAFLCLMRMEEVLRLEWHWIQLERHNNSVRLMVRLPWRKTHQTGGACSL